MGGLAGGGAAVVVLPAPVEGAMEADEGGARQPGRLPERLMESSDAEDAELGLRALLRTVAHAGRERKIL